MNLEGPFERSGRVCYNGGGRTDGHKSSMFCIVLSQFASFGDVYKREMRPMSSSSVSLVTRFCTSHYSPHWHFANRTVPPLARSFVLRRL